MGIFTYESNKSRVFIDGTEIELMSNIRCTDDYALEGVSGIGNIHTKEFVPTIARHQVEFDGYMQKNEKTMSSGIIPENGDVALIGHTFSIEIIDKDGPLLRRYEKAMCNNANASMTRHGLIMKGATFYATDVAGEFR